MSITEQEEKKTVLLLLFSDSRSILYVCRSMKTIIQVDTLRYFCNENESSSPKSPLPNHLNENRKYLENSKSNFPFLNLNVDVVESPESGLQDSNDFKTLLNHIHSKKWPKDENPEFVMDSKILTNVAVGDSESRIRIFRKSGTTFAWIEENQKYEDGEQKKFEKIFKNFFVGHSEDSEGVRALFQAKIPLGNGQFVRVMYSGKVDGIDEAHRHLQFNVIRFATSTFDFWKEKSHLFFWDSVFGNVPMLVIGTRTGTGEEDPKTWEPLCYPELSIYKIEKLSIEEIPSLTEKFAKKPRSTFSQWFIVDGEKRLQEFFRFLKTTVIQDDEVFNISKTQDLSGWKIEKSEKNENEIEYFDKINQFF